MLSLVVLFSGCQIAWELQDLHSIEQLGSHPLYYSEDFESLKSFGKISNYINSRVEYVSNADSVSPKETLERGYANCVGFSKLFSNIAYFSMGIEMDIVNVNIDDESRSVVDGGFPNHAICSINDVTIEPQTGRQKFYDKIMYTYDFNSYLY